MVNTQESLYEQLFPLTTIMRQRFVENFSGATLNERWAEHGSGTIVIDDAISGGLKITSATSGTTSVDFGPTDPTKIRQFAGNSCVMITMAQLTEIQFGIMTLGLQTNFTTEAGDNVQSIVKGDLAGGAANEEKFILSSTEFTDISLSLPVSVLYDLHTHKLELKSASSELSIDGILEATGGASITGNVMPELEASASEGPANSIANYSYCEVFNT